MSKFIQKVTSQLSTKLFKGDVVCPKCEEIHDHEGILEECECTKCGADLTGVLF